MKNAIEINRTANMLARHSALLSNIFSKSLKYGSVAFALCLYSSWNINPTLFVETLKFENSNHNVVKQSEIYSFYRIRRSFDKKVPVGRVSELTAGMFEDLILKSTPKKLRQKLLWFLKDGITNSEKYDIDPFWALSIMWVESHFKPHIRSRVGAVGPMQIMPLTGKYLTKFLVKKGNSLRDYSRFNIDPFVNIEMGIYYLSALLKRFKYNHTLATVAYNMGPTWVARRLKKSLPVGKKNLYLDKVRKAYARLTNFYRIEMGRRLLPYKITYAYVGKKKRSTPYNLFATFSFEKKYKMQRLTKFVSL